jgi:thioesterase domain-containing protein/acyl carrier protein
LDAFPLTPNGKVDRRALPAPGVSTTGLHEEVVPPRTESEWQLLQLWEEVLAIRPIGVRHNFFDLGGHSLLAVRLVSRIQQSFGRRLSLVTLFQHPTIESLAALLRTQQDASGSLLTLVRLHAGEAHRQPLFFVHGGGGSVLGYAALAGLLDPSRPFYGLHAPGLDGGELLPASVEAIARHYAAQLRAVQPHGPYLLGGWSFGGLVALEMAQHLQASGEQVALLALVDSHAPTGQPEPAPDELALLASFGLTLGFSWQHLSLDLALLRQLDQRGRLAYVLEQARHSPQGPLGLSLEQLEHLFSVFKHHFEAQRLYVPRSYSGSTVLFRAITQPEQDSPDADLGWHRWLSGALAVHDVPGDHFSLLHPPHVAALAEKLDHHLRSLDRQQVARAG